MNTILSQLNTAVTRRNIAFRQGNARLAAWWEAQAKHLAGRVRTTLVEIPGRPGSVVPAFWASMF